MASVKDMPLLQDGPPPGGFAPVRYARRISNTGPSAMAIFLTVSGAFAWGKLFLTNAYDDDDDDDDDDYE
ncbi:hypothetical protein F2Q69_00063818 [Brassica cretica]|uniref:NADH dehydrogenase [ubiquinone] 1 alpha subcomplex subunit 13 n=1 Tax=Brassica cretica TaxID=69181 RepID=A0A8S9RLV7_BRACR|nr:hypothetical protein F2Q69_00063818 [Brassica cretica]